jgi:phytoene desaturase
MTRISLKRLQASKIRLLEQRAPKALSADAPHAVVIGSGFGGLAAAIRLGVRGYRVTVLERLEQPGGRARVFRDQGFTFDAGPTVVTAPFLFEELWKLCGKRLEDDVDLRPVTPFYRIRFDDGDVFDYTGSYTQMRDEVSRLSPGDVEGYEQFVVQSEKIFRVGFEKLAHAPFTHVWDMARIIPEMMKLESFRTVYGLVSKYVKSEKLRQIMSFHPLLVGGNPFSTTSIYTLIAFLERKWGVHFPIGGTGVLVQGMVGLIEGVGGTVRCNAEVAEITVAPHGEENGRVTGVRLASGEHVKADLVVSDADAGWTYRHLLAPEHRKRWTDERIESLRYSMGLFVWYFGTKKKYEKVAHHTILLGPRYEELLEDIFEKKILAEDFSLYLHRPTATDPAMAPEGCDAFYVLSPVPHLESGTDWAVEGERYRRKISQYLSDTLLPGVEENLVTSRFLTPQAFHDDYRSLKGAAFSVEPVLLQSAFFRPHNQSEDVEGLYLVGAGTHPGAGLPGVLSSARVLDSIVPEPSEVRARARG